MEKKYKPHETRFPHALETKNLLIHDIEINFEKELTEIFKLIKDARISFNDCIEISTDIPYPVLFYIQSKGYRVVPKTSLRTSNYEMPNKISW